MCIRNLLYLLCTLLIQLCQPWRRKALFLGGHKISLRFRVGHVPPKQPKTSSFFPASPPAPQPVRDTQLHLCVASNSNCSTGRSKSISRRAHLSNGGQEQIAVIFHAPFYSHSFGAMTFWWIILTSCDSKMFISQPFSKAHFKLISPKKLILTLAPPQLLQLGGFLRLQAMLSRLFRGCQGLRMLGGVEGFRWGLRGSVDQLCLGKCCENMIISWKSSLSLLGMGIESSSIKIMMF